MDVVKWVSDFRVHALLCAAGRMLLRQFAWHSFRSVSAQGCSLYTHLHLRHQFSKHVLIGLAVLSRPWRAGILASTEMSDVHSEVWEPRA